MPRILIISHDVVGSRMAGPGIRAWHLARALAPSGAVTLVAPRPIDLADPAFAASTPGTPRRWPPGSARPMWWWRMASCWRRTPSLRIARSRSRSTCTTRCCSSNSSTCAAPAEQRAARADADRRLLALQLAAGDFFVCATERQRDLYLGALMLAGRLTPALADADPLARDLIDVAPFGLDPNPPQRQAPALRGVLAGIGESDPLLLWTGGLWDWLDPLTLIEAMPALVARCPQARLVFLAGRHPGGAAPMCMPDLARALAAERGLLGRHVFFYDEWVPYARRADFLLEATIAVSLHRSHLETAYAAVRSRFLDHLWAGLPSLVSDGDAAAVLVRAHGLGAVVPPGDVAATADALASLLAGPAALAQCGARARWPAVRLARV